MRNVSQSKDNILEDADALPDLLYHYTRRDIALEYILGGKRLFRLSPMRYTNDPHEYKKRRFIVMGSGLPPEGFEYKFMQTDITLDEEIRIKSKLACFTADTKHIGRIQNGSYGRGFARSRMWSQYGEGHRGVCLAFSKTKFLEQVCALKKTEADRIYKYPVDYKSFSQEPEHRTTIDGDKLNKSSIADYIASYLDDYHKSIFFEKDGDYRDENEYRIVLYTAEKDYVYIPIDDCLEVVVLGDRFPCVYNNLVIQLADHFKAGCKKLDWPYGKPILKDL